MAPKRISTGASKASKTNSFKPPRTSTGGSRRQPEREPSVSDEREQEDPEAKENEGPRIPPQLLTKLLHSFFEDDRTRMSKDANAAMGKYMDTFVREAIVRAEHEKTNSNAKGVDKFLEVEDLEKLAPQLLLDF